MEETLTIEQTYILNDLININNDRIKSYQFALKELGEDNIDLKPRLLNFIEQSKELKTELKELLPDVKTENKTTFFGRIYKAWTDVKITFMGGGRKAVLTLCEDEEEAVRKAYNEALSQSLPIAVGDILAKQQDELNKAYERIKSLKENM